MEHLLVLVVVPPQPPIVILLPLLFQEIIQEVFLDSTLVLVGVPPKPPIVISLQVRVPLDRIVLFLLPPTIMLPTVPGLIPMRVLLSRAHRRIINTLVLVPFGPVLVLQTHLSY